MDNQIKVFQVCECDSVAARFAEEALEWYMKETGLSEDELYSIEDIKELSLDTEVVDIDAYQHGIKKNITIREIVEEGWEGTPFIATTTEW